MKSITAESLKLTALALSERTRFRFLLCQKNQAARFCPSFGTEPYIELTLFRDFKFSRFNKSELTDVIFKTTFVLLEIILEQHSFGSKILELVPKLSSVGAALPRHCPQSSECRSFHGSWLFGNLGAFEQILLFVHSCRSFLRFQGLGTSSK
ncbi:hypothetical protein LEP1GSC133_4413 [Leptospira borgpetersenii serovar Pomona str. 200901868]|uniref:Uncharacterized protein n=1 Tax=Leptospira borgpetersenii serovar Pomona str. 200901868 TaxID=1192866 RepID=M6WG40_LEPBO|nr:hypothetical protein LEP1GSC133_4413 [Leptospira borgpetersenii serovar Pomona str. 200901868]